MKIMILLLIVFMVQTLSAQEAILFDGRNLDAFQTEGDARWEINQDSVGARHGTGYLVTKRSFDNFLLTVEFFPEKDTNSGLFLRCHTDQPISDHNCYEVNIFDSRPDPIYRTGGITNHVSPRKHLMTEGQWNRYEILAQGPYIRVTLNGVLTAEFNDNNLRAGAIALQLMKGGIRFKNIKLQEVSLPRVDLTGVWTLTAFTIDDGNGIVRPWCEGAHGMIMYTLGYMSVAINCHTDGSKMVHYSGPYFIDGDTVVHNVQNFSDPSLHQVYRRKIERKGNKMNLVGPFGNGGKATISWERR